ncbi:hypothetical protein D0X99_19300, partial [Algoriphagus lacus]
EVTQAIARFLPSYRLSNSRINLVTTGLGVTLISYSLFLLFFFLFEPLVSTYVLLQELPENSYALVAFYVFLNGIFLFIQNNLRWTMQSLKFAYTSLIYTFLNLISIGVFLFYLDFGLNGVLISGIISTSISIVISFFFQREYYSGIFSLKYAQRILNFSIPLILSAVAVYFSLYLDRLIINKYLGLKELAVFGVAFRFAALVGLATTGFSSALTPLIYNDPYSKTTKESIGILFRHFSRASLIFLLFLTFFSSEILIFLTTPEYLEARVLIPVVTCSMIFSSVYVFFPGLTLAKETGKLALINILSSLVNLGLCLLLIGRFGVIGVAFSTLISSLFGLVVNIVYSNKYYYQSVISLVKDKFILIIGIVLCATILYDDFIFVNSIQLDSLLAKCLIFSIFLIIYIIQLRKGSLYSN